MTAIHEGKTETEAQQTGHRPGRRPEEPRNSTVCFTVTEQEKAMIDAVGMFSNLRRSALLTRVVTVFVGGAISEKSYKNSKAELIEFLDECRQAVGDKADCFVKPKCDEFKK